jgi:hypothetical protein
MYVHHDIISLSLIMHNTCNKNCCQSIMLICRLFIVVFKYKYNAYLNINKMLNYLLCFINGNTQTLKMKRPGMDLLSLITENAQALKTKCPGIWLSFITRECPEKNEMPRHRLAEFYHKECPYIKNLGIWLSFITENAQTLKTKCPGTDWLSFITENTQTLKTKCPGIDWLSFITENAQTLKTKCPGTDWLEFYHKEHPDIKNEMPRQQ